MRIHIVSIPMKWLFVMTLASSACKPDVEAAPSGPPANQAATAAQLSTPGIKNPVLETHEPDALGYRPSYLPCVEAGRGTIEDAACMSDEMEYQGKRLNKNYEELMRMLDGEGKQSLREAQRLWVQLKEKDGVVDMHVFARDRSTVGNLMSMEAELARITRRTDQFMAMRSTCSKSSAALTGLACIINR